MAFLFSQDAFNFGARTFSVEPARVAATPQLTNLSGNFFASDENGAGVNLLQNASGQLFAVWASYGVVALPTPAYSHGYPDASWLVIPEGKWISPTEYQGVMYSTVAARYSEAWSASKAYAAPIGVLNLKFIDRNQVDMDAQFVTGVRKQKRLTRLQF